MNFWQKINKKKHKNKEPIFVLAPMADVTDSAFRFVIAKYGKPDVMWTEFVSADGLCSEKGREHLMPILRYDKKEKPIVAQIFSSNTEKIKQTAQLVAKLGFDGVDLNMGCPDRKIEKQGAGAALIKNQKLAVEIILAAKEGAGKLPVSVKTRCGYNKNELEMWLPQILKAHPAVVIIHARTRKEMSKVPANWLIIKRAVEIRNEIQKDLLPENRTLIFGNGDVISLEQGRKLASETGADGVMIGRGIFGNPWFFNKKIKREDLKLKEIFKVLIEHTETFEKHFGIGNKFAVMKKHFKAYVEGFDGAKELRAKLMEAENAEDVRKIIKNAGY